MSSNPNLLQNGAFDAGFYLGDGEDHEVGDFWQAWWSQGSKKDPAWQFVSPSFQSCEFESDWAQQVSTPHATHRGGLWQQVPVYKGDAYELTAEGMSWSSESDEPGERIAASDVTLLIGIDPTGGLDPDSPHVVWSKPGRRVAKWQTMKIRASAEAPIVTVFLLASQTSPKRQQSSYWRRVILQPMGNYRRTQSIVGPADTHLKVGLANAVVGESLGLTALSLEKQRDAVLRIRRADVWLADVPLRYQGRQGEHHIWSSEVVIDRDGVWDVRMVADHGARLLAQRLVRAGDPGSIDDIDQDDRQAYRKVYVLLPPTADEEWAGAAARGSFQGRYTVGYSADDAGQGKIAERHVLAVNPHHWPEPLSDAWFQAHYQGVQYIPIVARSPRDLEAWLRKWIPRRQ